MRGVNKTTTSFIAAALVLTACGGGSDDSAASEQPDDTTEAETDESDEPETTDDPAETDTPAATEAPADDEPAPVETDTTTEDAPADDEPATPASSEFPEREPGDGTTAAQAAAFPDAPFSWSQEGATWEISLDGLLQTTARDPEDGDCLVLFGTATATELGDWRWSNPRVTPDINLAVGDEPIEARRGGCDESAALASDHGAFFDPRLIPGSAYSFSLHYRLDGTSLADIEAIEFAPGDPDAERTYFLPTLIDAAPTAVVPTTDYSAFPATAIEGATVTTPDGSVRDVHDIEFQGVIAAPGLSATQDMGEGDCVLVLGSATAVSFKDGSIASFGGHSIGVLAGGRLLDNQQSLCDTSAVEAAGYQQIDQVNLTPGTSIDFFEAVVIPDELADSEQLVVTDSFFADDPQFFSFTPLGEVPAPLAKPDASVLPASAGSMTGGPFVFQEDEDDTEFTINLEGVVNAGQNDDGTHTCFFILGTATADQEENTDPSIRLSTAGQFHDTAAFECGARDVEDQGWENIGFAEFQSGVELAFFELVLVPNYDADGEQFVVIGDPKSAVPHIVLDPVYLDAVPAR